MSVTSILEPTARADGQVTWDRRQRTYWTGMAPAYDSLYAAVWSSLENELVAARIRSLDLPAAATVIDLGCGTGLGARLLRAHRPDVRYLGVDLSPAMAWTTATAEGVPCVVAPMDNLDFVRDGCADAVLALFSTFSFARDPGRLLAAITRILKPGGRGYVSALSSEALSGRAARRTGWYRTRGDTSTALGAPAHRYTARRLVNLAEAVGLVDVRPRGTNAFSGFAELPLLWPLGCLAARAWPDRGHIVEITFRRPENQ